MPSLATKRARFGRQVDGHVLFDKTLAQISNHKIDDLHDFFFGKALEDDDLIDAVQEFRAEKFLYLAHHALLHFLVVHATIGA